MLSGTLFGRSVWWMLRVIKHPRQLPLSCCCCYFCWCSLRGRTMEHRNVCVLYHEPYICFHLENVHRRQNGQQEAYLLFLWHRWTGRSKRKHKRKTNKLRTISSSCTLATWPKESESHFKCTGAEKANILLSLHWTNIQMCLIKLSIRFCFRFFFSVDFVPIALPSER